MTQDDGFIGVRCTKAVQETLRRLAKKRGFTMTKFVLLALDSAFAADDRSAR
ncbi:MAG: hypothetical protein ACRD3C_23905 [Vicinamibacterales bacterium]